MLGRLFAQVLLCAFVVGSGGCFGTYSSSDMQRAVQSHPTIEGLYILFYRQKMMIDEYGPGWDKTLAKLKQAKSAEEIHSIWEDAARLAVPRYMKEKGLVPNECHDGIHVVSSRLDEGGGGTAAFRCK